MKNSLDSSGRFKTNRPYSTFTFCSRKFDPAEVTDQYSECMVLKLKFAYIHDWLLSRQSSLPSGVSQDLPAWGPFLERPGKFTGPVSYFEIEVSTKVGCVLTSNEVYFVSLVENFTV